MISLLLQIPTEPATASTAVDFTWLFVKMLGALGVVSVLAILTLKYLVPKLGFARRFQEGKFFQVLQRHTLEPKKHLYLMKLGQRYCVLGASDSGIQFITDIPKDDIPSS
ncbi:MAG: FliO/MopB family protein [Deltaproteobacteria bacterium]|nr:FliO/MopB family protein [Deltaproteobacteria bacterium]